MTTTTTYHPPNPIDQPMVGGDGDGDGDGDEREGDRTPRMARHLKRVAIWYLSSLAVGGPATFSSVKEGTEARQTQQQQQEEEAGFSGRGGGAHHRHRHRHQHHPPDQNQKGVVVPCGVLLCDDMARAVGLSTDLPDLLPALTLAVDTYPGLFASPEGSLSSTLSSTVDGRRPGDDAHEYEYEYASIWECLVAHRLAVRIKHDTATYTSHRNNGWSTSMSYRRSTDRSPAGALISISSPGSPSTTTTTTTTTTTMTLYVVSTTVGVASLLASDRDAFVTYTDQCQVRYERDLHDRQKREEREREMEVEKEREREREMEEGRRTGRGDGTVKRHKTMTSSPLERVMAARVYPWPSLVVREGIRRGNVVVGMFHAQPGRPYSGVVRPRGPTQKVSKI